MLDPMSSEGSNVKCVLYQIGHISLQFFILLYGQKRAGSDLHLIPINENIQLKVLVVDEYYGDGDYAKYVMADSFRINEKTSTKDVDVLIDFIKTILK